jgi:RNA polymerase sigma factor (sigma-70 family)
MKAVAWRKYLLIVKNDQSGPDGSKMLASRLNNGLQCLRRAALLRDGAGLADGQLLECFVTRREEAAFEAIVRRHGPMVMGVCRRVLGNRHDAEDAFQATFLVLVRKAGAIMSRELLANWLYGVAYNTALKAKAATARRRVCERRGRPALVAEMSETKAAGQDLWSDLRPVLDVELSRLPDKYRVPIILCDLEGKTRKEAARQLGWPEGTLSGRLARGRRLLAAKLTRRAWRFPAALWPRCSPNKCRRGCRRPWCRPRSRPPRFSSRGEWSRG